MQFYAMTLTSLPPFLGGGGGGQRGEDPLLGRDEERLRRVQRDPTARLHRALSGSQGGYLGASCSNMAFQDVKIELS